MLLTPLPLSQTVTVSHLLGPSLHLKRDVLYGRPLLLVNVKELLASNVACTEGILTFRKSLKVNSTKV